MDKKMEDLLAATLLLGFLIPVVIMHFCFDYEVGGPRSLTVYSNTLQGMIVLYYCWVLYTTVQVIRGKDMKRFVEILFIASILYFSFIFYYNFESFIKFEYLTKGVMYGCWLPICILYYISHMLIKKQKEKSSPYYKTHF